MRRLIILFVVLMTFTACTTVRKTLSSRGEVLKEYEDGKDYFMIIKEGNKIVKYRIYKYTGPVIGTGSEIVYSIDTFAQICLTGRENQILIDCEKIKSDPDLGQYIDW